MLQFVVPLGATINMNGTVTLRSLAALFVANLGYRMNLLQQLIVFLTACSPAIGARVFQWRHVTM